MNFENSQATGPVGSIYGDTSIEASRTQESNIEAIRAVRSAYDHECLAFIKSIHLDQQLVEGLFALVVSIDAGSTLSSNRVNFIDKDDAWRCFFRLLE